MRYNIDFTMKPLICELDASESNGYRLSWMTDKDYPAFEDFFVRQEYAPVAPDLARIKATGLRFLLLRVDGEIVACAGASRGGDGVMELHYVAVEEVYRGHKLAFMLEMLLIFILKSEGEQRIRAFPRPPELFDKWYSKLGFKKT